MKKKTIQVVQLFTAGSDTAEISAELLDMYVADGCLYLKTREEKEVTHHMFPLHNVSQVRTLEDPIE